jgi:hypothetical protein
MEAGNIGSETIYYLTATDQSNNFSSVEMKIYVTHDKGKK